MNIPFLSDMAKATDLTRAGKLMEATRLLQRQLGGFHDDADLPDTATDASADFQGGGDADVIEGAFTVVGVTSPNPGSGAAPAPLNSTVQAPIPQPAPKSSAGSNTAPRLRKARKPLAETLRDISSGGMPRSAPRAPRSPGRDQHLTHHTYKGAAGSRDYLLFVPYPAPSTPCPVVVMLHGCTQSPQDFADGTQMNAHAQSQGVIVIYPAQPAGANMNKCWNWFRPSDQVRDTGEPAILAAITQEVLARENADPARVYVAGLSAGGAAAAILSQAYPDVFAAAGVHSGLAAGAATDVGSAFSAMRSGAEGSQALHKVPTIVFHGTADATVHIANAHAVAKQSQTGMTGKRATTKGKAAHGRSYTRSSLSEKDRTMGEVWLIDGAGHAWAGGSPEGSYTDPTGPDASAEMLRFFAQHRRD